MNKRGKNEPKVYVLIDVSNIRSCCLRTCDFRIDFVKLIKYLQQKYPNLQEVRYYEGIAQNDIRKNAEFHKLAAAGYIIKSLARKTYLDKAVSKNFKCKKCGQINRVEVLQRKTKLKSNVDVFLATEMLEIAYSTDAPIHFLLLTCDGDYAETIMAATKLKNVQVTVVATPAVKDYEKNTLSIRLKKLRREIPNQFSLFNISDIKDFISK